MSPPFVAVKGYLKEKVSWDNVNVDLVKMSKTQELLL